MRDWRTGRASVPSIDIAFPWGTPDWQPCAPWHAFVKGCERRAELVLPRPQQAIRARIADIMITRYEMDRHTDALQQIAGTGHIRRLGHAAVHHVAKVEHKSGTLGLHQGERPFESFRISRTAYVRIRDDDEAPGGPILGSSRRPQQDRPCSGAEPVAAAKRCHR